MNIGEAVAMAMRNIAEEQETTIAAITRDTKITEKAIYRILDKNTKNPGIATIHEFCCGAGYTLVEFFERKEFDDLD